MNFVLETLEQIFELFRCFVGGKEFAFSENAKFAICTKRLNVLQWNFCIEHWILLEFFGRFVVHKLRVVCDFQCHRSPIVKIWSSSRFTRCIKSSFPLKKFDLAGDSKKMEQLSNTNANSERVKSDLRVSNGVQCDSQLPSVARCLVWKPRKMP